MNSANNIKLRKFENHLRIAGIGVVIFGVWSFFKAIFYLIFSYEKYEELMSTPFEGFQKTIFIVMLVLVSCLDILFRAYIGRHAMYEARGEKTGSVYIVFSCIIVIMSGISVYSYVTSISSVLEMVADILAEMTSMFITIELIGSAIMIKRYRNNMKIEDK